MGLADVVGAATELITTGAAAPDRTSVSSAWGRARGPGSTVSRDRLRDTLRRSWATVWGCWAACRAWPGVGVGKGTVIEGVSRKKKKGEGKKTPSNPTAPHYLTPNPTLHSTAAANHPQK
jgi:hypothetical protein